MTSQPQRTEGGRRLLTHRPHDRPNFAGAEGGRGVAEPGGGGAGGFLGESAKHVLSIEETDFLGEDTQEKQTFEVKAE